MAESVHGCCNTGLTRRRSHGRTLEPIEFATFEHVRCRNDQRVHVELHHHIPTVIEQVFWAAEKKSRHRPLAKRTDGNAYRAITVS